ncbi:peroxisomal targeting signal 2 receptor [Tilletia horrida]|uniref:Peroxin-7 n=1 Tax=Tilletia horrida TaxID=155126 RepID=A0AAN6GT35_9BASI|nr:peroxisomal targeting signal 2 receptor [Tilletia horrida]KAK0552806.1 peroxisomal targeting signal 2 receptor [Tilletia horrida]KAK0567284.1 peroxisomal targeting signal 2 receptor [Tilletia horrida]
MQGPGGPQQPFSRIRTPGFAGYNVRWSPFFEHKLAVASAANYGLIGNGRVHVLHLGPGSTPEPGIQVANMFDTQDGLFDVAWSEMHENHLASSSGDGSISLWDISHATPGGAPNTRPIAHWRRHTREVFSLSWSPLQKHLFASSSWDGTLRIWSPEHAGMEVRMLCLSPDGPALPNSASGPNPPPNAPPGANPAQPSPASAPSTTAPCIYTCAFSPHSPDLIATGAGDGYVRIFDLRIPSPSAASTGTGNMAAQPIAILPVMGEVLSLDWNKYVPGTLATGSTDRSVKVWDLRGALQPYASAAPPPQPRIAMPGQGTSMLSTSPPVPHPAAHAYAIRHVAFSPHASHLLASASYDMSARIWDTSGGKGGVSSSLGGVGAATTSALVQRHDAHTEFVAGVEWSLFSPGTIASCAWDSETHIWRAPVR